MSDSAKTTATSCEKCGETDLITGTLDSPGSSGLHGFNSFWFYPNPKCITKAPVVIYATACKSCGALFDFKVNIYDPQLVTPEKKNWLERIL